jgi:hypothetical protein
VISGRGPAEYVPRLREKLSISDDRWGRLCAEHALPLGWESMEYMEFLRERRRRMADIIRVAFRQLGGEPDAPPLTPPWFLPGAEAVWQRIVETERALRGVVREVYTARFGETAARRIEEALPERERETLARALRARPVGSEPLSIVVYLYLGQLPPLLFVTEAWQESMTQFTMLKSSTTSHTPGTTLGPNSGMEAAIGRVSAGIARVRHKISRAPKNEAAGHLHVGKGPF